jgi:hypothetical protein
MKAAIIVKSLIPWLSLNAGEVTINKTKESTKDRIIAEATSITSIINRRHNPAYDLRW